MTRLEGAQFGEPSFSAFLGRVDGTGLRTIPFPRTIIHPQFHPLDPEWIEFAADPAPRMFCVRRDGSGLECLYQHGNDEFVVHETFLGTTGDLVFAVWPYALRRLNWSTAGSPTSPASKPGTSRPTASQRRSCAIPTSRTMACSWST
jgi:hypothetical protein